MSKILRAGVIGAGVFGGFHAAKYVGFENVRLVGVFDAHLARAGALADRYGCEAVDSVGTLFDRCDLVSVATPAATHFDYAHQALRAGLHVYVEKPIALDVSEAASLIQLAKRRELLLQVGHQERLVFQSLDPPVAIAGIQEISSIRVGPASGRCEDVSVVLDLMIHDIDLIRLFGWGDPLVVDAAGDDHEVAASLRFGEGRVARLFASRRARRPARRFRMSGGGAEFEIDFMTRQMRSNRKGPNAASEVTDSSVNDPLGGALAGFLNAVSGRARPLVTGDDGAAALDWALKIEHARAFTSLRTSEGCLP